MPSKEKTENPIAEFELTKGDIDVYLLDVAKEYRRLGGRKMKAEIIIIGGASILINYGFRMMTNDIDALLFAPSTMKEAINRVGDLRGLPRGWLNEDFKMTKSYSPALVRFSTYYKTFANVLEVRTIKAEYLIAMKLTSMREYKHDYSDILGVLSQHKDLTLERIENAYAELYGKEPMSESAHNLIAAALKCDDYQKAYQDTVELEAETRVMLKDFEKEYKGELNESNIVSIGASLRKKKGMSPSLESKVKEKGSPSKDEDKLV